MNDSVRLYFNEIGKVPLLTADEEKELARRIETGREARARIVADCSSPALEGAVRAGDRAKDRFIRANLRLVVSIARRYPPVQGMDLLDHIQEGNLGLEHAVDKFDWRRGLKFSTYATFWIRQAIGRAIDQKATMVRLPAGRAAGVRAAVRQAESRGEQLDPEHARLRRLSTPVSLDGPIGDDADSTLVELLASNLAGPEQVVIGRVDHALLHELLDSLDARARHAVEARFGLVDGQKQSLREIGQDLGVSAEAARRLVQQAVARLREDVPEGL